MQARVDVFVPYGQADAAIHTFHAFGDRIVREHAFELGLGANVRLLSRAEQIVFLREHVFDLGLDRYRPLSDPTRFLGALADLFTRAKDEDLTPDADALDARRLAALAVREDAPRRAELEDLSESRAEIARAFSRYTELMAASGYIDHSDQIALALRLLRARPSVAAELGRRFRHILVDELQDTNRVQLQLVLALAGPGRNVMAVGDPAQGIYGFRGARAGNVDRLSESLGRVRRIELRRNYRSLSPIVAAAERVLESAPPTGSRPRQVAHRRSRGVPLRQLSFATPQAEADGVADEISRRIEMGASPSRFAVLVRSNSETDEVVRSLRVRGVDVDTGAVARLFDVPQVRALLAFVRVVADPDNSVEAFTLAAAEPYQLDGALLTRLMNGARRRNRSLLEALRDTVAASDPGVDADAVRRAALFVEHVSTAVQMAATQTSGEILYDYLRRSGTLARLARAARGAGEADARSVARFCELVRDRAALLASDRIGFLARALELGNVDDDADPDLSGREAVKVLTVHRAKGLEFDVVFISGLVDGRFPIRSRPPVLSLSEAVDETSDADRGLAEERRLFYVAVTRARDELVLTSHEYGPRGKGRRRPSIFIAEAIDAPIASLPASVAGGASEEDIGRVLLPPQLPEASAAQDTPLTLSYSQIDEYLTCPERYRLRYDIGVPTPAHHALSYGTAIHQAIAAFHAAQQTGVTLSDEQLVAELRSAWQPDGYLSREHEDARFAAGAAALRSFRAQQVAAGSVAPSAIERPFVFRLGRDQIRGRIDRIDVTPVGSVITDYKSSDVRDQKRADAKARDSLQLHVYALAHQAETGTLPSHVQLHFVESGVVGSAQPSEARLDKAREKLTLAAEAIRARNFQPKPSAISCGYCPFRTICTASAT
jgi:DNA helicase-2/ATP-dependent DNA helicase PcrA